MMRTIVIAPLLAALLAAPLHRAGAQELTTLDRERARVMLHSVRHDLEHDYFDTTYGGMNLAQRFDSAERRIDAAKSNGELFGIIAQVLVDLDDSHTFFLPPQRAARVRFGWELLAVGDSVYVAAVQPGSGAERSGLHTGDRLVSVNGYTPVRQNLWKLRYLFEVLRPQPELLVVAEDTAGAKRALRVAADITERKQRLDLAQDGDFRDLFLESSENERRRKDAIREQVLDDVLVWKLAAFSLSPDELDTRLRALHDKRAFVLDLRGNPGGYVATLQRFVGHLVAQPVVISTGHKRRGVDTLRSKPVRPVYAGRVVVLVDSRSASAAELFSRVMQLNERATVLGDWSAGAVVVSQVFGHTAGAGRLVPFGASVSIMDVRTADGGRLEKIGVLPDEERRPTGADLAAGRDPVLARALALVGVSLSAEEAGRLFPARWDW